MESKNFTKVHVDLPRHWAVGGESMWARALGDDLYELQNVPFHAYDLNFLDVVEAVAASPDLKPAVLRVVRRSGHRTLRVIFSEPTLESSQISVLESLRDLSASFEKATKKLFAIDIKPDGDYQGVCDRLAAWAKDGLLEYETCEARAEGTFDDKPEPPAEGRDAG